MTFARERFDGAPFNAAPQSPPAFRDVTHEVYPEYGKRLIVARWDAEHYEGLALRGYSQCPHRKVVDDDLRGPICDAAFYPGYPALGWLVRAATGVAIDYALFGVSLSAAVIALFLWTDPAIVNGVGLGGAYASLLAFNFYPPSCYLVLVMTDACAAAGMLAGFVALARRRYVLAACAVGFTGAIRISGVGAEGAFALAVLAWCMEDPPKGRNAAGRWLGRLALVPLGAWGSILVSGYQWARMGDPLLYVHGHEASFRHKATLSSLLHIKPETIIHGIDGTVHDLVWAGALVLFLLMGHRIALRRFPAPAQAYAYALAVFTYVMSAIGSIDLWYFQGLARYVMVVVPAFLCIGVLLKHRPLALAFWLFACAWNSREVDLCFYLGDVGQYGLRKCNMGQWIAR
ncbi:MAG: hypothetical protein ABSC94_24045 [Polyangiaceae bacterium]